MASPGAAQQPAESPHAAAPAKPVPRRTSLDALLKEGSLAAAAVGQAGLGLGLGSQDLTGLLLDPSLLQHMQSLPRGCSGAHHWGSEAGACCALVPPEHSGSPPISARRQALIPLALLALAANRSFAPAASIVTQEWAPA